MTRASVEGSSGPSAVSLEEARVILFTSSAFGGMRSMETMDLLVITELKGVTYACESSFSKVEDLDLQLAACRTLQPL